jgi:ATP-binding cassette subfamily C (CFTR/MRP) protein 4
MYTWERFFGEKISKARREEMTKIKQIYFTKATSLVIGGLVINVALYIIVMTYTYLGHNFTAEVAFFLLGCLHTLRSSVTTSIPIGIAQTAEMVASVRRIDKVLTAEEQLDFIRDTNTSDPVIKLVGLSVKIKNTEILHNINLTINSGLNFVTGRLGGGKSSLLKTILEEYPISDGKLTIRGSISYASEEPWLFPSSIKQNILFGKDFHGERYQKVLNICALEQDINTFENGDETIVDDRGMNLSKGQQARISLARAVYADSDIYLLDNCLSSLDTHVQEIVFTECIKTFLKDKIVFVISHNERLIKEADNIIVMENGTIKSCLKPSDIPDDQIEELVREEDKFEIDDIFDNVELDEEEKREDSKLIETKPYQNIYHEKKKEGKVALHVYKQYFRFGGPIPFFILIVVLFVGAQVGTSISDKLVSNW